MRTRSALLAPVLALVAPLTVPDPAYAVAPGILVYMADFDDDGLHALYRANLDGTGATELAGGDSDNAFPAVSPDGTKVAYSVWAGFGDGYDIYVRPADGSGAASRLTSGTGDDLRPAWSPDGTTIAFDRRTPAAASAIYTVPAAGGPATPVPNGGNADTASYSPSGRQLLVRTRTGAQLAVITLATGSRAHVPGSEGFWRGRWSPDGAAFAVSGVELRVLPARGGAGVALEPDSDGIPTDLAWSNDGQTIWYSMWPAEGADFGPSVVRRIGRDGSLPATVVGDGTHEFWYPSVFTGASAVDAVAPAAVTGLTATLLATSVQLSWASADADATEFVVRRSAPGGPAPATVDDGVLVYDGYAPTTTVLGLTTGATYAFAVFARDASGNTGPATTIQAQPLAIPSVGVPAVTATRSRTTAFPVSWTMPVAGGTPAGYDVDAGVRKKSAAGHWVGPYWSAWRSGTTATSGTFGGTHTATHYFRVRAVDAFGNRTATSAPAAATVPNNENFGPSYAPAAAWTALSSSDRYLGTLRTTSTGGARFGMTVDARGFAIVGDRCPVCGQFRVFIDGRYAGTYDSYAPKTYQRQTLFFRTDLPMGIRNRTIGLVAVATPGRPQVRIDAVAAIR